MELDRGRIQQKYRTRRELLAAARRLLERKQPVTVQTAADEAEISRATAYRYFTSAEYLKREAFLESYYGSELDQSWEATAAKAGGKDLVGEGRLTQNVRRTPMPTWQPASSSVGKLLSRRRTKAI